MQLKHSAIAERLSRGPIRALVVEDCAMTRLILEETMAICGYEVKSFANAEEALAAHQQQPFRMMVIDWMLPGMSGLDFCRQVRRLPAGHDVVLMVVTGNDQPGDLERVLAAGASDYLAKPIEIDQLRTRLLINAQRVSEIGMRRGAELALRTTEAGLIGLATTIDSIGDAVIATDLDGRIVRLNPEAVRLTGWSVVEAEGMMLHDVVRLENPDGSPAESYDPHRVVFRGETVRQSSELVLEARYGVQREVAATAAPIRDASGAPSGVVLVLRDVTEERASTRALLRSQRDLRQIMERNPDGMVIIREGQIVYANPTWLAWMGYLDATELFEQPIAPLIALGQEVSSALLLGGPPLDAAKASVCEIVFKRRDGAPITLEVAPVHLAAFEGRPATLLAARDITARREAERALRESEDRSRAILNAIPDLIVRVSAAGIVLDLKGGGLNKLTLATDQIVGAQLEEVLSSKLAQTVRGWIDETLGSGAAQLREYAYPDAIGGQYYEVRLVASGPAEVLAMVRDVTAARRLESQLLQSDRLRSLGTMAAGFAHEINNPLACVTSNLDYAREMLAQPTALTTDSTSELIWALNDAHEAAQRVKSIVQEIRTLSQPDNAAALKPVGLTPIIDAATAVALNGRAQRIEVTTDYRMNATVMASEQRLGQVFRNLLWNAAEAVSHEHAQAKQISITTEPGPKGQVLVSIRDAGPGVPAEVLDHIFDPFFTTKTTGASGLGLAVSHRIITALGGTIAVESALGSGTTFRVMLPAAVAQTSSGPPVKP